MPWHCSMRSRILASLHFPIPVTCSRLPIEKRSLAEHLPKIVLGHGKITFTKYFLSFFLLFFFLKIIKKSCNIHFSQFTCSLRTSSLFFTFCTSTSWFSSKPFLPLAHLPLSLSRSFLFSDQKKPPAISSRRPPSLATALPTYGSVEGEEANE